MKCKSCDDVLSSYESTMKYEFNDYIDLCSACLEQTDIVFINDNEFLKWEPIENE